MHSSICKNNLWSKKKKKKKQVILFYFKMCVIASSILKYFAVNIFRIMVSIWKLT